MSKRLAQKDSFLYMNAIWRGLIIILLTLSNSYAASCGPVQPEIGTLDTRHFIPPQYAPSGLNTFHVERQYLLLSTPETSTVTINIRNALNVTNPALGLNQTVTITKATPLLLDLNAAPYGGATYLGLGIVTDTDIATANKTDGIALQGDKPFYAQVRHLAQVQGNLLIAKGQTALGRRFRTGHIWTNTNRPTLRSHSFSIMATENSTTVQITGLPPGVTLVQPIPSSLVLNKYESFTVAMRLSAGTNTQPTILNELNGTLITANKPVVVNSGSWLAGGEDMEQDIGMDQIIPTNLLSKDFLLTRGASTDNAEAPLIVADTNNTAI